MFKRETLYIHEILIQKEIKDCKEKLTKNSKS